MKTKRVKLSSKSDVEIELGGVIYTLKKEYDGYLSIKVRKESCLNLIVRGSDEIWIYSSVRGK